MTAAFARGVLAQDEPPHPVPEPVRQMGWNTMFVMLVVLVVGTTVVLVIMRRSTRRALGLGTVVPTTRRAARDPWREAARRAEPAPIDPTLDMGEDRLAENDPPEDERRAGPGPAR